MELNKETIRQYKDFLENPAKYDCTYKPIRECFSPNDYVIPQHILYELYVAHIDKPLPKVIFYIIMRELYAEYQGKAPYDEKTNQGGEFGYRLKMLEHPAIGIHFVPVFNPGTLFKVTGFDEKHETIQTEVNARGCTFSDEISLIDFIHAVIIGEYKIIIQ